MIFNVEVEQEGENGADGRQYDSPGSSTRAGRVSYSGGGQIGNQEAIAMALGGAGPTAAADAYEDGRLEPEELAAAPVIQQRRVDESEQLGRNDPCWCGSGKKFKKCHGA
jgi:preprotein translocase subunit SecA